MNFKKIYTVTSRILLVFIILGAGATSLALYFNEPPSKAARSTENITVNEKEALMEVYAGESAISAGERLQAAGLIKSAFFWEAVSRIQKEYIKNGEYIIPLNSSSIQIYTILKNGGEILNSVTIPEGSTINKTASIFEKAQVCNQEEFIKACRSPQILKTYGIPAESAEGYLYPDTYKVPKNYPAEKLVSLMIETFYKRLKEEGLEAANDEDLFNKIILASIVEREYRVTDEAPLISGVFANRLKTGMRLESCATVEYIITEIEGKPHPKRLWEKDIKTENPYNTYLIKGLPPGPIGNPGSVSIKAAFFPEETGYLFFRVLNEREGRHYFSRTLDDHIKAAGLYVKG
ncbi:MAG: endolytic transglycosylase MltG [Spirochaetaceae bacterium]|jgi:UPF0755 protein|nr:endolytic transglycosylase MltG [Spirochaetaceae bacterium]